MLPTLDDPSFPAGAASSSFPDADAYGNGDSDDIDFPSDPNQNPAFSSAAGGGGAGSAGGERRPLFQRLWTEEDEIVILRAFAEFTAQRGTAFASHQYDTDPFYGEMRQRLQLDFSKSQLVEKLRRLKRKYRNCVDRLRASSATAGSGATFAFRSPHEQAIFEIARNIWRPTSDKHARGADSDDDAAPDASAPNGEPAKSPSTSRGGQRRGRRRRTADSSTDAAAEAPQPYAPALMPMPMPVKTEDAPPHFFPQPTPVITEPTAAAQPTMPAAAAAASAESSILAPLFKEMVRAMLGAPAPALGLGLKAAEQLGIPMEGERWRQQRILELEVYLRRIDLLQDQVRSALDELKSTPPTH